jgi:hypothetical protein
VVGYDGAESRDRTRKRFRQQDVFAGGERAISDDHMRTLNPSPAPLAPLLQRRFRSTAIRLASKFEGRYGNGSAY